MNIQACTSLTGLRKQFHFVSSNVFWVCTVCVFQWEVNYELRPGMLTLISLFYTISVYVSPTPSHMADIILKPFFSPPTCVFNANILTFWTALHCIFTSLIFLGLAPNTNYVFMLIICHVQFIFWNKNA